MGPIQTIEDLINLLRRRGVMMALIITLAASATLAHVLMRPEVYEAIAVIQVQSPSVGEESQTSNEIARLLQTTEQQLTTRESLLEMIERHDLFSDTEGMNDDNKIYAMRTAVTFQSIATASQQAFGTPTSVSALTITVRLGDAEQAARVANDFAQNVLDRSIASQASRARDAATFFQTEEERISRQISALDDEIERFKAANPVVDETTIAGERATIDAEIRAVSQEILAAQAELASLREKDRLRETDRRRIIDLEARETVLKTQRAALEGQRENLVDRVARTPEIERQLGAYARNLEQLQSQFQSVSERKVDAETTLRLEQENHANRFSMLERAVVPEYPVGGGRKKLLFAGTMGGIIAAFGLALLLEMMNPVIRTSGQMYRQVGIRPVITLPELDLAKGRPKQNQT
ncbi:MAG: Wzz/FepE/Etk N-terminal domain-containing protein [Gemmobacter sp.]